MAPTLLDGDYIIACKKRTTVGAIALILHSPLGLIVKRIFKQDENDYYQISGDNPASTPSDALGQINPDSVLAIVCWRISTDGIFKI